MDLTCAFGILLAVRLLTEQEIIYLHIVIYYHSLRLKLTIQYVEAAQMLL